MARRTRGIGGIKLPYEPTTPGGTGGTGAKSAGPGFVADKPLTNKTPVQTQNVSLGQPTANNINFGDNSPLASFTKPIEDPTAGMPQTHVDAINANAGGQNVPDTMQDIVMGREAEANQAAREQGAFNTDLENAMVDTTAPIDTPYDSTRLDQMYRDIMMDHESKWANQKSIAEAEAASQQRRAAEMMAGMGAGVGGGTFASGMAQAGLKGQETMMRARKEHDLRGMELQMTNLQNQLKIAEAQKDRDAQEHIQNLINNTALAIENARLNAWPDQPDEDESRWSFNDAGQAIDKRTGQPDPQATAMFQGGGMGNFIRRPGTGNWEGFGIPVDLTGNNWGFKNA